MSLSWTTPAGNLGTYPERVLLNIPLNATSSVGNVQYSIIAGNLPRGLQLISGNILGSPVEVVKFTESRFVVRASDGVEEKDRTFSISVDGSDAPEWVTPEGFLNVGAGEAYFVLDNAPVDFRLEVVDPDIVAGDNLEFYLLPNAGELPPGLSISREGRITGFTDPIFSVVFDNDATGAFDTAGFDITPLDIANKNTNGYDTFLFDGTTFDYNEESRVPRRLSRAYAFSVAVTDGENVVSRLFKIYVVTEEFLKADNNLVQVDTNLFQADATSDRSPFWITDEYLGRWRANNRITIRLDTYDPPSLRGTTSYLLEENNPDGGESVLPPGMTLDSITGDISGSVPYQAAITKNYEFTVLAVSIDAVIDRNYTLVGDWSANTLYNVNQAVRFNGLIYICVQAHTNIPPSTDIEYWIPNFSSESRTFNIDIIGELESAIDWITSNDLGEITPNKPSFKNVEAESSAYGGRVKYELVEGTLPPGLTFLPTGIIQGKVRQFADENGLGLTSFADIDFDSGNTTFDRQFDFTIRASDFAELAQREKEFTLLVKIEDEVRYSNLFLQALQSKEKRLNWFNFITDATIFTPDNLYRYGDPNFSVQTDLRVLIYAGIESVDAVNYVQAMSRNHYRKRLRFGDLKKAKAKDPNTQETMYEVIYVEVTDEYESQGRSISNEIELSDSIESKVLTSFDAIKVDSDIPFVSDSDHQRIFPNSVENMRNRIRDLGQRDRTYLPLWMRSIQDQAQYELGYTKALVLCYAKPGRADTIMARIRAKTETATRGEYNDQTTYSVNDSVFYKGQYYTCIRTTQGINPEVDLNSADADRKWNENFNFKSIDFVADRYIIDVIDGNFEDKYLAFPQRGEKLP